MQAGRIKKSNAIVPGILYRYARYVIKFLDKVLEKIFIYVIIIPVQI